MAVMPMSVLHIGVSHLPGHQASGCPNVIYHSPHTQASLPCSPTSVELTWVVPLVQTHKPPYLAHQLQLSLPGLYHWFKGTGLSGGSSPLPGRSKLGMSVIQMGFVRLDGTVGRKRTGSVWDSCVVMHPSHTLAF